MTRTIKLYLFLIVCSWLLIKENECFRILPKVCLSKRVRLKRHTQTTNTMHIANIPSSPFKNSDSQPTVGIDRILPQHKQPKFVTALKVVGSIASCVFCGARNVFASEGVIVPLNKGATFDPIQGLLIWVFLFILSAIMHGAESSITKISPYKVQEFADEEGPSSPFATLHQNLTRLLITILLTTTACCIYSTALFVTSLSSLFPQVHLGVITATLTVITLFFGELLPKALAVSNSEYYTRLLLPPLSKISFLLTPLTSIISFFSDVVFKSLGMEQMTSDKSGAPQNNVSEDMLRMVIHEAQQSKEGIASSEGRMMNAVLDMQDKEVSRVMSPRIEIIGVPENLCVTELISMAVLTKYSRIPVYKENIDHITGVIFTKDLLNFIQKSTNSDPVGVAQTTACDAASEEFIAAASVGDERLKSQVKSKSQTRRRCSSPSGNHLTAKDIAKPAFFIPETMSCWNALQEMRKRHVHIAIVVDEYGGTSGLVTLEDILEEVIGEIYDEDDSHREESNQWTIIRKEPPSSNSQVLFLMKGIAELDDVCEALKIPSLEAALEGQLSQSSIQLNGNGEYTTLGGLLCCLMGKIPTEGDQVEFADYLFTIVKVEDARRIVDVIVQPIIAANTSNNLPHDATAYGNSTQSLESDMKQTLLKERTSINRSNNEGVPSDLSSSELIDNSTSLPPLTIPEEKSNSFLQRDHYHNAGFSSPTGSFCCLSSNDEFPSPSVASTSSITMPRNDQHEKFLMFRDGEWIDPKEDLR